MACPAPKKYNSKNMIQEEYITTKQNDGSSRSLEEIPLTTRSEREQSQQDEQEFQEFNVKPGMKMLPLDKIRPTIGMNLAKVDLCNTKCRIWDVGGKMHDLWERYYDDADAVIYCITTGLENTDLALLEQTRLDIDDDVPFLVFHHNMDNTTTTTTTDEEEITLDDLLPRYHNNLMNIMSGSARTGEGVREALEWLIPLAKRQQQLRQQVVVPEK